MCPYQQQGTRDSNLAIYQCLTEQLHSFQEGWKHALTLRSYSSHLVTVRSALHLFIPLHKMPEQLMPNHCGPLIKSTCAWHGRAWRSPGRSVWGGFCVWVMFDTGVKINHLTNPGFVTDLQ